MNSPMVRAAIGVVRLWTELYTCALPSSVREARRAEIASDVWHAVHDPDRDAPWRLALQMILRLVLGIRDDLGWRWEQPTAATTRRRMRTVMATGALCALVLAVAPAFWRTQSPPLPQRPEFGTPAPVVHPPPAPPAPPAPPDAATDSLQPVPDRVYGQTSYTVTTTAVAPIRIKDVRPVYPPIAIAYDVRGVVVVQATITDAGRVADARVIQPVGLLSQSAIDAVKQWEFAPSDRGGTPVKSILTVRVTFTPPS
jgi:TonB family protein